jgi:hypothetical protein
VEGKLIDRGTEHFKEMLNNVLEDEHEEDGVFYRHAAQPKTEPPTDEEVEETIARMKNRAPGEDNLLTEFF